MFNIINILYNNPKLQLLGNYCGIYYIWHMSSAAGAALCQIRRRFDANASSRTTRIGRIGADCRWLSAPNGWHFSIQKWLEFCHQTMGICWHQTLGIEDLKTLIDPSKLMTYAVCRMIFVHFGYRNDWNGGSTIRRGHVEGMVTRDLCHWLPGWRCAI